MPVSGRDAVPAPKDCATAVASTIDASAICHGFTFISIGLKLCKAMTVLAMTFLALLPFPITYEVLMRATGHPTIWVYAAIHPLASEHDVALPRY